MKLQDASPVKQQPAGADSPFSTSSRQRSNGPETLPHDGMWKLLSILRTIDCCKLLTDRTVMLLR